MIYFVGAGPGAPDLITLRGYRYLRQADVIIYAGSLVNPELLQYAKKDCQIYDSAVMTLEEVLAVMIKADQRGKNIVRLHTGDPSLYGAVREQMDALRKRRAAFEICPGVSSMAGAAASLQVEYTLPGVSQTVIISRVQGQTPVPERESLHSLASHGSTMILFLSAGLSEKVKEELINSGYSEDTCVAVVYKATWEEEKILRTTLKNLSKDMIKNNISNTALIIIGDILEDSGDFYERSRLYDPSFTTGFRKGTDERR